MHRETPAAVMLSVVTHHCSGGYFYAYPAKAEPRTAASVPSLPSITLLPLGTILVWLLLYI